MMKSLDSIPTESRIVPPLMPSASRAAGDMARWLVDSGCVCVVDNSPSDGQKGMRLAAAMNRVAASVPPAKRERHDRPEAPAELPLG